MKANTNQKVLHLIANLTAGRGRSQKVLSDVKQFFAAQNVDLKTYTTDYAGHATVIAESLAPDAFILSLGGDGTLHEIINACVYTERTIAVIPAGSGDDFAFSLGIHTTQQGLETVMDGVVTKVDCGLVETEHQQAYFINSFGVGFDAEVGEKMQRLPRFLKGQAAYFAAVFWQLFSLRNVTMSCYADGQLFFEGGSLLSAVQNGKRTGGSFYLTPHASIQDGLFDVLVAGRLGVLETLTLLPKTLSEQTLPEQLVTGSKIHRIRAKEIVIECSVARLAHLEGEELAASRSFKATVLEKALKVLMPTPNDTNT